MKSHASSQNESQWRGYTLDELRYERMLTLTRIEIEKAKLQETAVHTRESLPFIGRSAASNFFKKLSVVQYVVIAFKVMRKLSPLFKKK